MDGRIGVQRLARYQRADLRGDLIAAVTVTAYLIPQVMAYSALAGLAPENGLWIIVVTMTVYALIGTSRVLSVGPESTTALLTAATIAPLALGDPVRYASLAALLAFLVGGFALLAWLLRLGFLGDLLSKPVLVGYMAGVAVIMITSQLGKVTGVEVAGDTFIEDIRSFVSGLSTISWPTVAVGLGVAALLLALTPRFPRLPIPLFVVAAATIIVALLDLDSLQTVGEIDAALPSVGLPGTQLSDVSALALPALGIFVVGYADNILTSRLFAQKLQERVHNNHEFLAMGAANIGAGAVSGFPVSSSASRTVIAYTSGARTQLYGLVAAVLVVITILLFGNVIAAFPEAALGGLVIYAAIRLVDVQEFRRLWGFRRREFLIAIAALLGVLLFDILYGVLAAVAISVVELLARVARPHSAVLGQAPDVPGWHDIDDYPAAAQIPGLVIFRYDSPLFFANAEDFAMKAENAARAAAPPCRWLLLNMEGNTEVDITGLDGLAELQAWCERHGIVLALVRVKHEVIALLDRHGVGAAIGHDRIYPTLPTAVAAYEGWAAITPPG
jgi:high affinity sulfate transporter 1